MFYPTTCVGFGTGGRTICLAVFLGSRFTDSITLPEGSVYCQVRHQLRTLLQPIYLHPLTGYSVSPLTVSLLRPRFTHTPSNGMFTVSAIRSASRLPVRSRLTLIRLALIRNPWSFGEGFSPPLSLLIPTFAFPKSPACLTARIRRRGMLPLPTCLLDKSHSFGTGLMPDYYPRSPARLVSCYALFK